MAVNKAAAAQAAETSEREYQDTINDAVKATEKEIFADALGDDELDMDGDTSLEDMGDGLEGEVEEDDAEEVDGQGEDDGEPEEGGEDAELEAGEAEGDEGAEDQPRDKRGQFRQDDRRIPPGRLREEAEARRNAEAAAREKDERINVLQRQLDEYNGRITELSARVNSAPQRHEARAEPAPKPDMFAEPEKYEAWVIAEAERRAEAKIEQRFTSFQQQQQQRELQRVDRSLETAARGTRAFEFSAAYNALTSLNPKDRAAQQIVGGILAAPDPAKALFDWWDENGGPEYRETIRAQLFPDEGRQPQRRAGERQESQARSQIRHEIRGPQRLPSLNSASGSNSQRTADPEMMDGSEASIFRYGTRP